MNLTRLLLIGALLATPVVLYAAENPEPQNPLPRHFPTHGRYVVEFATHGSGGNLSYHGGPVLTTAYVVPIYWGPSWTTTDPISSSLTNYLEASSGGFGTTGEYNVITQYYQIVNSLSTYIKENSLCCMTAGGPLYDSTSPPTNVTDADLQAEVLKVTSNSPRSDTIYEVFLPNGTYSSDGTATSCGGTNLQYCAYHGSFTSGSANVKYASMPYPSCSGCQSAGFTATQNFEHFISHETREAVTDENSNAWYDKRGYEADDKCAWSPTPFTSSNGTNADGSYFAYQYEWSNAASGCVKTK